ncbi:circularly permuted type 2 ATP-grasp protein [Calidifontibacter terrae]
MSAQSQEDSTVLRDYAERVHALSLQLPEAVTRNGSVDEWLTNDGPVGNGAVIEVAEQLGLAGLLSRRGSTARHVRGDGLTYGAGSARNWTLDPLPVVLSGDEWGSLETGLAQRAELLDLVLTDLYGERRLIADGIIPAAAVLGHDGFLPAVDGVRLPGARQLVMASVDLARSAEGTWTVLADRTQAPSGAGYAMADRRIVGRSMSRLYRNTSIARLRGFFDQMSDALYDAAPVGVAHPHIAVFSPGPDSETAFDQAFLASLLGLPLVQAEDLTMRDGKVWRRTTHRPQQIDVLVRRVDAAFSDPLDLRGNSRLGVPGLTEACRRGTISVVNPLGCGVLENPALVPYLPAAARALLGQDLRLPDPQTWWFGDHDAAREAYDRLNTLVIKPISRATGDVATYGWELDDDQLATLKAQIEAEPWRWAAQEQVAMSTAPVIGNDGLEPRRFVLRAFGVGDHDGYRFLPGGLGRVSADGASWTVSNQRGGVSKDVWVLAGNESTGRTDSRFRTPETLLLPGFDTRIALAPRVADDLFWWGRYTERAESTARLLSVVDDLVADNLGRTGSPGHATMEAMVDSLGLLTGVPDEGAPIIDHLRRLLVDPDTPGTIAYNVHSITRTSYAVRELLSTDTWLLLSRLETALGNAGNDEPLNDVLAQLLESLLGLAGVAGENTVRDEVWTFMDLGRRIERSLQLTSLLRSATGAERSPVIDGEITAATLRAVDSAITFRRRLASGNGPASPFGGMLQLLLRDPINPRSLEFQLGRMRELVDPLGDPAVSAAVVGLQSRLVSVRPEDLAAGSRLQLSTWCAQVIDDLRALSDLIADTYFVRPAPTSRISYGHQIGVRQ